VIKAVLFDLDNTLYSEFSFVISGMRAVAAHLGQRFGLDPVKIAEGLLESLKSEGRGATFDLLLKRLGLSDRITVPMLVYLYRTHRPQITLFADAIGLLEELKKRPVKMGVITDGLSSVQSRKIAALGIEQYFDAIICTGDLSEKYSKPSPVPFALALHLLDVEAKEAFYVGDDETKDFAGPQALGIGTIQIKHPDAMPLRTGPLINPQPPDFCVTSLRDVTSVVAGKGTVRAVRPGPPLQS
jgi:putative hydrolase of the HAD superfamily